MHDSVTEYKYRYAAFGLDLQSTIELTTFPRVPTFNRPSIFIQEASVDLNEWHDFNNDGSRILGLAEGAMRFKVHSGEQITFDTLPGADLDFVRAILSGELMSALLRQRGLLVLHASAVERDGQAIGLVGGSGFGKSTLAIQLVTKGFRLISDDLLALDLSVKPPLVLPGHQEIKLNPDTYEMFVGDYSDKRRAYAHTEKRLVDARSEDMSFSRLRKVYVLDPMNQKCNIVPLSPRQALIELIRHTRASNLIKEPSYLRDHLHQCEQLLDSVPVSLVQRSGSLEDVSELAALIQKDLAE